ncbi:hypothetical protein L596_020441 [Steinernema carpocapsae]|uniref:Uncharacterized protein n=1 Tax=Steinernema carpocapsae TaxID=34508 RepID=A0A4U5MTM8_STECR|nr:hypothetical protein L596_020441 [Steinernema carpocapsae]
MSEKETILSLLSNPNKSLKATDSGSKKPKLETPVQSQSNRRTPSLSRKSQKSKHESPKSKKPPKVRKWNVESCTALVEIYPQYDPKELTHRFDVFVIELNNRVHCPVNQPSKVLKNDTELSQQGNELLISRVRFSWRPRF